MAKSKFYITKHLNRDEIEIRNKLVQLMKKYREEEFHAIIKNNKLLVNGRDVSELPYNDVCDKDKRKRFPSSDDEQQLYSPKIAKEAISKKNNESIKDFLTRPRANSRSEKIQNLSRTFDDQGHPVPSTST